MPRVSLLDRVFRRALESRAALGEEFIVFDSANKPRFDLAGYFASDEGGKALERFAAANRKSPQNPDEGT
jgi:hypothetical protein